MPVGDNNRFEVKGVLEEVKEEEYKEGKTLARFLVKTQRLDFDGDPEPVEVEFSAFGKSRDIVLNSKPGVVITVRGHLESRYVEANGRWYPTLSVSKVLTEGNPQVMAAVAAERRAQVEADEAEIF